MYSKRASKEEDPDIPAGWVGLAWYTAEDDHRRESKMQSFRSSHVVQKILLLAYDENSKVCWRSL